MRRAMAGVIALAIAGAPTTFQYHPRRLPKLDGLWFEHKVEELIERNRREKLEGPTQYPAGRRSARSWV